jgi:putative permease
MTTSPESSSWPFISASFRRFLPNPQAITLAVILLFASFFIYLLIGLLMPVFVSIVLAYLLNGLVEKAEKKRIPHLVAVYIVFSGFLTCLGFALFVLMPMVSEQAVQLVQHIPSIVRSVQSQIMHLPQKYPQIITETRIKDLMFSIQGELLKYWQTVISGSAASVIGLVSAMIYLFLVPFMVFFFLKDKVIIVDWFLQFIPRERHLTERVWKEIDIQLGNYVRGKFIEVLILWFVSYIAYSVLDLNYAMLLAVLMGLSVIIPYVGATLVTFPVIAVAYMQWGLSQDEFMYVMIAYSIIQAVDGVVLVPLLFSEAVNLHPVAIIVAILFFGGLWGFWGVFFAIPLATVVKSVITAWPRAEDKTIKTVF